MLPSSNGTDAPANKMERSSLISRNITIIGHRTSVRLEPDMWNGLGEICKREHKSLHEVCSIVAEHKAENTSLTAAIRVFVMAYFRMATTEDGHTRAGHGPGGGYLASLSQKIAQQTMLSKTSYAPAGHSTANRMTGRMTGMMER